MARHLDVLVTTPEGEVFRGKASKVIVPALDGELGILPRHAPLIAQMGVGELRLTPAEGAEETLVVTGGFVQVLADRVVVLASTAEPAASIDRARAEEDLQLVLAEAPPAGPDEGPRAARREKIRLARARLRAAR